MACAFASVLIYSEYDLVSGIDRQSEPSRHRPRSFFCISSGARLAIKEKGWQAKLRAVGGCFYTPVD